MTVRTTRLQLKTRGDVDVVDVTDRITELVRSSGVSGGAVVAFVPGSTAAITTVEYEPGLVADLETAFERLVPSGERYAHNHGGDSNGHAHVRASIVGPSVAVPIVDGSMTLGTWQQIVLIDFDDRPRARDLVVQISGEP